MPVERDKRTPTKLCYPLIITRLSYLLRQREVIGESTLFPYPGARGMTNDAPHGQLLVRLVSGRIKASRTTLNFLVAVAPTESQLHSTMKSSYIAPLAFLSGAAARTFTVYNACPFTIWPAMFTDLNVAPNVPSFATGWEAASFTKVSFTVPNNWAAGRIWGRRDCDFSTNPGPNSCLDGGCNGGLLCDPHTGTGVPPATVAEWTLSASGNEDFYDVSLVDGYNLPMRIDNNVGCPVASCPVDLGPNCPAALKGPFDSTGFPVGCKSACDANLDGNQANSPNCCSGSFDTPATCPPSGVTDYSYFKGNCPDAYAYAFDESSGTALWTCNSALNADYTLTFCP